jgi:undecaprenyl-diphosphatase
VWRRSWNLPMLVVAMLMVGEITNYWLKLAIGRDRPSVTYVEPAPLLDPPGTPSLPSGHATTSFLCATLIAFSVPRLAVPLYVLAALVAWSRVYAGVHYPLDTVAGAIYGVALAFAFKGLQFLARRRAGGRLRRP